MNERIKELKQQATEDVLGVKTLSAEKFAELIVQECANIVLEPHNESNFIISMTKCKFSTRQAIDRAGMNGGLRVDTESVSNQILKHFGIK